MSFQEKLSSYSNSLSPEQQAEAGRNPVPRTAMENIKDLLKSPNTLMDDAGRYIITAKPPLTEDEVRAFWLISEVYALPGKNPHDDKGCGVTQHGDSSIVTFSKHVNIVELLNNILRGSARGAEE